MNNCHKQFPIGTRVEVTREYEGVPKGTKGVVDEHWEAIGAGITIAWDSQDRPLPDNYIKFDQNSPNTNILRDGFSSGECSNLKIL